MDLVLLYHIIRTSNHHKQHPCNHHHHHHHHQYQNIIKSRAPLRKKTTLPTPSAAARQRQKRKQQHQCLAAQAARTGCAKLEMRMKVLAMDMMGPRASCALLSRSSATVRTSTKSDVPSPRGSWPTAARVVSTDGRARSCSTRACRAGACVFARARVRVRACRRARVRVRVRVCSLCIQTCIPTTYVDYKVCRFHTTASAEW